MTASPAARRAPAHAVRLRTVFNAAAPEPVEVRRFDTIARLAARQRFRVPVVAVLNGEPVLRRDGGWKRRLKRGDRLVFVECAAGGGGVKNVFRTALNIALVLSASWIAGPAALGLTGFAKGAFVLGAYVGGAQLINSLLPPEQPGGTPFRGGAAASPTYSLTAAQNAARLGGVRPRLYGRHLVVPDLDAAPYTEYAGNDQYLHQVLTVSLGEVAIREIRLADTVIWDDVNGDSGIFEGVDFEVVPPGGEVTKFPANVVQAAEVNGLALPGTNEDGAGAVGPFIANPAGTEANLLSFDIEWLQGAGRYTATGGLSSVTTTLRFEAQAVDNAGDPLGDWEVLKEESYIFSTLTPQRLTERFPVSRGRWRARVTRVNDTAQEEDDKARDAAVWSGLRAHLTGVTGSTDCTRIAIRMKANGQLSGLSSRLFRVLAVSKLLLFEGFEDGVAQWSAPQETRDIFPIAMDMLRNAGYGAGYPDARIDIAGFASLHETWAARGDTFDGVFDTKVSLWKALQDVLRAGRAEPQMAGDTVTAVRDEPRETAAMLFTPANVQAGSFSTDYVFADEDSPDSVIVEFWNEESWSQDEVLCALPGSSAAKPARIQAFGIVNRTRAWRYGIYRAAANRYRRTWPSLASGLEGRILGRGAKVLVAHPLPQWGAAFTVEGYDAASRLIALDGDIPFSGTTLIRLRDRRGRVWGPCRLEATPVPSQAILNEEDVTALGSPAGFIVTAEDRERTLAAIGAAGGAADHDGGPMECRVVAALPGKGETVQLTLVNDDPRVYTADEGDPPPIGDVVTPPSVPSRPQLQPLVVSQNTGTAYAPRLSYSVAAASGASLYIWSISYDHVTWTEIKEGAGATSGEVDVLPTTVWIACTAIGPGGRDRKEVLRDLTITEAAPGEVTGLESTPFAEHCFVDFTLPKTGGETEEGLSGVIARYSATTGFDPEDGEEIGETIFTVRNEPATTRLLVPLIASPTYIRVAAYNVFGEAGLNWSSEISVTPQKLTSDSFSAAVVEALANASAIEGAWVVRLDSNGRIAGVAIVDEGELGGTVTAGWLVDKFQIAHPTINGGDPFPAFVVEEGVVKVNELVANVVTAENIYAALIEVGILFALKLASPLGPGETIDDAKLVIDTQAPYILMRKPAP